MTNDSESTTTSTPIADLNLSVRARRCVTTLAIATAGELAEKTASELLACKNFGATSLKEIREKLANLGLKLKGE